MSLLDLSFWGLERHPQILRRTPFQKTAMVRSLILFFLLIIDFKDMEENPRDSLKKILNLIEVKKSNLDSWSSFVDDTLSNSNHSDDGIDVPNLNYRLKVIGTTVGMKPQSLMMDKEEGTNNGNNLKCTRVESMIENKRRCSQLDIPSAKEKALIYLRRNNKAASSFTRNNSMANNENTMIDFKQELLNGIHIPRRFKLKHKISESVKRCQSLPKRPSSILYMSECKSSNYHFNLVY